MRLRILSDLHLECGMFHYLPAGEDLIILAGDVADQSRVGRRQRRRLWDSISATGVPAVYVLGNHEFYRDRSPRVQIERRMRRELPPTITMLNSGVLDIGGIRILGCTLWSDCGGQSHSQQEAEREIADFAWMQDDEGDPLSAVIMAEWHHMEREWLDRQIETANRPVVVVTHWQPSAASTRARDRGGNLTPYFETDCRDLLREPVCLWVHGHIHDSMDTIERGVRIICNPRGYVPSEVNAAFDDHLIVTVNRVGR